MSDERERIREGLGRELLDAKKSEEDVKYMKEYYTMVKMMEARFPIGLKDSTEMKKLSFTWCDTFKQHKKCKDSSNESRGK